MTERAHELQSIYLDATGSKQGAGKGVGVLSFQSRVWCILHDSLQGGVKRSPRTRQLFLCSKFRAKHRQKGTGLEQLIHITHRRFEGLAERRRGPHMAKAGCLRFLDRFVQ